MIIEWIVRAAGLLFAIGVWTWLSGTKRMSEMTFFHYVCGIAIGLTAVLLALDRSLPWREAAMVLCLWTALAFLSNRLSRRKAGRAGIGPKANPMRSIGSDRLDERSGIVETEKIYDLRKENSLAKDSQGHPFGLFTKEIIVDGKVVERNLSELHLSKDWLQRELDKRGVETVADVFYAELTQDGNLHIDRREDMLP